MEFLWIYLTIIAVFLQTIRNSIQKSLGTKIDAVSVVWSRFLFALPILFIVIFLLFFFEIQIAYNNFAWFLIYSFLAAFFQIAGTILLVNLFAQRNFLIGIAYMKTEIMQTAILGMLFFAENINFLGFFAVLLGTIGLIMLSPFKDQSFFKALFHKTAIMGLLCGFYYSLCALFIKSAILEVKAASSFISALTVLISLVIIQNLMLLIYKSYKKELRLSLFSMFNNLRKSSLIGVTSVCGSMAWFYAFAIQTVAYVKLLGQLEILLSLIVSQKIFKEKTLLTEIIGILLIVFSILIIVF